MLQDFADHDGYIANLPVLRQLPSQQLVKLLHAAMPQPQVDQALLNSVGSQGGVVYFFTDGSCMFPHVPAIRYATFGIICDIAPCDADRCVSADRYLATRLLPDTLVPLTTGRLQGRQTINRAELQAVVWIYERFPHAVVTTDSSYAKGWVERMLWDPLLLPPPHHDDADLLQVLRRVLRHTHVIRKIKSHQDATAHCTALERYAILGNMVADNLVNKANKEFLPAVQTTLHEHAMTYLAHFDEMKSFWQYLLDLNFRKLAGVGSLTSEETDGHTPVRLVDQLANWQAPSDWVCPDIGEAEWLSFSKWGLQPMWTLLHWIQESRWPLDPRF